MLKFTAPLAAIAVALVSTPAFAGDAKAPSIRVEYKDLNLNTADGRKELDVRLKTAAKSLCPAQQVTGTRIRPENTCYDTAMKSIRAQLAAKGVGEATVSASR